MTQYAFRAAAAALFITLLALCGCTNIARATRDIRILAKQDSQPFLASVDGGEPIMMMITKGTELRVSRKSARWERTKPTPIEDEEKKSDSIILSRKD